jgi:hypothetical protein
MTVCNANMFCYRDSVCPQSVRLGYDPQRRQRIFPLASVQTSTEAHPASCTMCIEASFPGGKARLGRNADHSPHLVPRSRMSRSYISSPLWRLHCVAGHLYFLLFTVFASNSLHSVSKFWVGVQSNLKRNCSSKCVKFLILCTVINTFIEGVAVGSLVYYRLVMP